MRCVLVTCNGYRVIREVVVGDLSELPALCRAAERSANDDYCVFASHNGDIVADAEGMAGKWRPGAEYQAGYAYACGYRE